MKEITPWSFLNKNQLNIKINYYLYNIYTNNKVFSSEELDRRKIYPQKVQTDSESYTTSITLLKNSISINCKYISKPKYYLVVNKA